MKKLAGKVINRLKRHSSDIVSIKKQNLELKKFHNIHKGKDCIIMGAGPSLSEIPKSFLENFVVIGSNLSFKYYKPDYWVVIDAQYSWLEEGRKMCYDNNIPAFINWLWAPKPPEILYPNEIYLHPNKISNEQSSSNIQLKKHLMNIFNYPQYIEKRGVTSVNSVVPEGAIPLALYMGFERIFLTGVDFYTPKTGKSHFMEDTQEDQKKINKLTKELQNKYNSKRDLFDFKRWPIEMISESKNSHKVFNLSEKSTVKKIPKVNCKDVSFKTDNQ